MKKVLILNIWGNCVAFDESSKTFQISSACDTFALTPNNRLKHLSSNSCVVPQNLSHYYTLKLNANCDHINSVFQQTGLLQLKHVDSGMCIYPQGGGANPPVDTELVLKETCDNEVQAVFRMAPGNYK